MTNSDPPSSKPRAVPPEWPDGVVHVLFESSVDGTPQPALARTVPDASEARPLLVGLHTWSGGYLGAANGRAYARWAIQENWHFVHPNFRGPNDSPEAIGSDLAVQDIVDAVREMQKRGNVDASRIYLVGCSGGGHMALLMAGRHPGIWAGVSAWVPIADIGTWHEECSPDGIPNKYATMIETALGGPPDVAWRMNDAMNRSPVTWLANAKKLPVDINHGVHDGRRGSVPFAHSLRAFNAIAATEDRLPENEILEYYDSQRRPNAWPEPGIDALYGAMPVLFRKTSGNARVTIFEAGHEIHYAPAFNWLSQQRRGSPAEWKITNPQKWNEDGIDTQSGK